MPYLYIFRNPVCSIEKENGSTRINWILALIYKIGGKWAVSVILAIVGAFHIYSGISKIVKKKQN